MAYVEGEIPLGNNGGNGTSFVYPMMPFAPYGGYGYGYGNNGGFFGNGDGIWAIILFAMIFGWGGNGNGWGFGGNGFNTTTDVNAAVQRGFDTSAIMGKLDTLTASVADADKELVTAVNGVNTSVLTSACATQGAIKDVQYAIATDGCATRGAITDLGYQVQNGFCNTNANIADLKYALASESCDIRNAITMQTRDLADATRASTDAILGFLTNEKISDLQLRNAQLAGELSQRNQTNDIINALRPVAQPAYLTCSPFESYYGLGNGCGCSSIQ